MKKFAVILTVSILIGFVSACGGQKPVPAPAPAPVPQETQASVIKRVVISQSANPTPSWVNKRWEVGKDEMGRKVIYLAVEGEKPTKEKANADAEGQKISRLTELIKQVATREFAIAKQGMLNDNSELDTYFEETIAAVSKNVNIGGAVNVEDYWEYIQEIQGDSSKTFYRMVKRYMMDYEVYQKSLQQAWEPQAKQIPPELKDKAQKVLDSINKSQQPISE